MTEFRLFAHGENFDPDTYLATTSLNFDGVWNKGSSGNNHPQSSGVFKVLGDGDTLSILEQDAFATQFLLANRDALKALANYPGVTTLILGLQFKIELTRDVISFCVNASIELMQIASDIGIAVVFYVSPVWQNEQGDVVSH